MSKILGLDLGTNSIGWAIVENHKENFRLLDKGVHIFTEGVKKEKGSEKSRAAERTAFRAARRLKFRRKIRKYKTLKALIRFDMCPLSIEEVEKWRQYEDPNTKKKYTFKYYPKSDEFHNWLKTDEETEKNPYYFRDRASREKIDKLDLGRAFYHIAQRRGFLSNRLDKSSEGIIEQHKPELEAIVLEANNSVELLQKTREYFECFDFDNKKSKDLDAGEKKLKTLYKNIIKAIENKSKGKELNTIDEIKDEIFVLLNEKENLGTVKSGIKDLTQKMEENHCETLGQYFCLLYKKYRNNIENKIRRNYTAREEHYEKEFYQICKAQNLSEEDIKKLYKAIFYQRPLKSQKGLVGKCSLEKNKPRCPVSHPLYEEYRMYCFINNIKIKTPNDDKLRSLTKDEKDKIIPKFFRISKKYFNFDDLAKSLIGNNDYAFYRSRQAKTAKYIFNFKPSSTVTGCPVSATFKQLFGDNWRERTFTYKTLNRKKEKVTRNVNYHDIWHVLFSFNSDKKIKEFAEKKLKLNEKEVKKFCTLILKKDYASLSIKAIKKIVPYLKQGLIYSHAVFMANLKNIVEENIWKDENNKKQIENGINIIIEEHTNKTKIINVVNSAIKECKEENNFYSEHNNQFYKSILEEKLENVFGSKTWNNLDIKDDIFTEAFNLFVKSFKENKYLSNKRIDEEVIDFILGKNDTGELFCSDEKRIEKLYHPSDIEIFKKPAKADDGKYYLGSPMIPSIKNPMAMRALHQLRKLINQLIKENKIDENTKIHIELARELNDANKRKAIERYQREREKKREEYKEKIIDLYKTECENIEIVPTEDDILKYQLWEEQNHICLYTGNNIGICDFIGQNLIYDIEHTIPRSKCNDNSLKNKTLCENQFNRETKINKIPSELSNHEDILQRIQHWKKNYDHYEMLYEIRRRPKGLEDKDKKDKRIQEKHYYKMHADYWKAKYERFIMEEIPDGFKNSQLVDTGIITKYSKIFLKSIFDRVYSVKGSIVADFRKIWGIQEEYKEKERKNHVHHCIDAVVIACLTKNNYDKLAHYYREEEKWEREESSTKPHFKKPWETFSEDMKDLENEILVSHYTPDNLKKRAKKKSRKRGKIIYNSDHNPIYLKGDSVRGSLHKDTFYGAIAQNKEGIIKYDNAGNVIPNFVVRKELEKLKETDIKNIVDSKIRQIVENAVKNKAIKFNKTGATIEKDVIIWQNEKKQIPLKKVRVYTPSVKNPIDNFKKHRDKSKHKYKQQFNVINEENYCMALYEGKDKKGNLKRSFKLINNMEVARNLEKQKNEKIIPNTIEIGKKSKTILNKKGVLKKGVLVIFYENNPDEIWKLTIEEVRKRLYKVIAFENDGRIQFRFHQEAQPDGDLNKSSSINFETPNEKLRLSLGNCNILIQNTDFKFSKTGKIEKC